MSENKPPAGRTVFFHRTMWIGLFLFAVAATAASYLTLDTTISRWILDHPNAWHRNVWVDGFRQLGKADVPIWLLLIWGCLTNRWRPTVVMIVAMILVGLCVCPLKTIVHRSRPSMTVPARQSAPAQDRSVAWSKKVSFPSGDTAVVFAGATTLSFSLARLWTPALFLAAAAVGLLRITAGVHYPSDVVAGAMIGVLCGLYAVHWMTRRREPDELRVKGWWRLVAVVVLFVVMPLVFVVIPRVGPSLGLRSLQIFCHAYWIPLIVLVLIYLAASSWRARGPSTRPIWLKDPKPEPDSTRQSTS